MKLLDIKRALDCKEQTLNLIRSDFKDKQSRVKTLEECIKSNSHSKNTSNDLSRTLEKAKIDLSNANRAYKDILKEYCYLRVSFEEDLAEVLGVPVAYRGKSVCITRDYYDDLVHVYFGYDEENSAEHYIGHYSVNLATCLIFHEVSGLFAKDGVTPLARIRFLADDGDRNDSIPSDYSIEIIEEESSYADFSEEERWFDAIAGRDDDSDSQQN